MSFKIIKRIILTFVALIICFILFLVGSVFYSSNPSFWPEASRIDYTMQTCDLPLIPNSLKIQYCLVEKGMFSSQHCIEVKGDPKSLTEYIHSLKGLQEEKTVEPYEFTHCVFKNFIFFKDMHDQKNLIYKRYIHPTDPVSTYIVFNKERTHLFLYTSWS
jgi:hypothetical protein